LLRRRNKLSFGHHQEVCSINDQTMQDKMLDWCLSGEKRKTVKKKPDQLFSQPGSVFPKCDTSFDLFSVFHTLYIGGVKLSENVDFVGIGHVSILHKIS